MWLYHEATSTQKRWLRPQFSLATHIYTHASTYMRNHAQNPEFFTLSLNGNPTPPKQPALETHPAGSLCRMAIVRSQSRWGITANAVWQESWMLPSSHLDHLPTSRAPVSHGGDSMNRSEMLRAQQTGRGSCTLQREVLEKTVANNLPYQSKDMREP